jgi:hypothetical protein
MKTTITNLQSIGGYLVATATCGNDEFLAVLSKHGNRWNFHNVSEYVLMDEDTKIYYQILIGGELLVAFFTRNIDAVLFGKVFNPKTGLSQEIEIPTNKIIYIEIGE